MYLLDTNVLIVFMKGQHQPLLQKFTGVPREHKHICTIVAGELLYGAAKSQQPETSLARARALLNYLPVLTFDLDSAYHFGDIRAHLSRAGTPIGPYDLQIAAIARAHNLTLVTHNVREFSRVPDLKLEDWQAEAAF
jgi:tRNA(fMet)-specific endonuclease VapC